MSGCSIRRRIRLRDYVESGKDIDIKHQSWPEQRYKLSTAKQRGLRASDQRHLITLLGCREDTLSLMEAIIGTRVVR